jgi:hypothetical protein
MSIFGAIQMLLAAIELLANVAQLREMEPTELSFSFLFYFLRGDYQEQEKQAQARRYDADEHDEAIKKTHLVDHYHRKRT